MRNRILLFFSLFALVSLAAVYLGGKNTQHTGRAALSVVSRHLPMVYALGEMEAALLKQDAAVYRYTTTQNKKWLDAAEKSRLMFAKWYVEAERLATEGFEQDTLREIDEMYVQYENQSRQILLVKNKISPSSHSRMLAKGDDFLVEIKNLMNQIKQRREGMTTVRREQIENTLNRTTRNGYYYLITIGILFVALSLYLLRFLVGPLALLVDGIRNFTRGRMDVLIPPVGKDELGELQEAFNEMAREISLERKRLKTESHSDSLTGLFNMRYFRNQLSEEFSRSKRYGRPLSLLMLDVDHFKTYNDRNGHPAGDIVLKEVSRIMIRSVRGTDIVARYGGEEFVILLPETSLEAAAMVGEKIRRSVEVHTFPFSGSNEVTNLTVSVGVAAYPDVGVSSDQDLIESSDKALYSAKEDGRNKVYISQKNKTQSAHFKSTKPLKRAKSA